MDSQDSQSLKVIVWNEFVHERENEQVKAIYPDGIHRVIADALQKHLGNRAQIRCATLDEPEHGLPANVLEQTDVLLWWGHAAHDRVDDNVVARVQQHVLKGMGLIVLHSGHGSKIFQRLMGTTCMLRWREAAERERLWIVTPGHPILHGIEGDYLELPQAEMYGEHFDIPEPDELLMISWFEGGEVFRSACTFQRGQGKIFYFRPGHETYPQYHQPEIQRILVNGVLWCGNRQGNYQLEARHIPHPLEELGK